MTQKRTNTLKVVFLFLSFLFIITGCEKKQPNKQQEEDNQLKITSTRFNVRSLIVVEGDNETKLPVMVNYKNCDNPNEYGLTFKSSDENLITVDENGVINAKEAGNAKISVLYQDGERICTDTIKIQIDLYFQKGINAYVCDRWDKNGDRHLSLQEASNVTNVGEDSYCYTTGDVKFKGMKDLDYVWLCYRGGIIDFSDNPNLRRFYIYPNYARNNDVPQEGIVEVYFYPNSSKLESIYIYPDKRITHVTVSNYEQSTELTSFRILSSCDMDIINLSKCHKIAFLVLPDFKGTLYLSPETFELFTKHNNESEEETFLDKYFVQVNPEANVVVKYQ